jgi:hypothetical protein
MLAGLMVAAAPAATASSLCSPALSLVLLGSCRMLVRVWCHARTRTACDRVPHPLSQVPWRWARSQAAGASAAGAAAAASLRVGAMAAAMAPVLAPAWACVRRARPEAARSEAAGGGRPRGARRSPRLARPPRRGAGLRRCPGGRARRRPAPVWDCEPSAECCLVLGMGRCRNRCEARVRVPMEAATADFAEPAMHIRCYRSC